MEISTQKYSFVVEREVVHVTADMLDNYGLELWMESNGFRCRTQMADVNAEISWPPTYPGIYFTPFSDPEAETVYAYVNDYLVFSGYGQVEVMKSVDFNKAQPKLID
jgi:hypothetical protein